MAFPPLRVPQTARCFRVARSHQRLRVLARSDWQGDPDLVGERVYQLPEGPTDVDLPFACPAGFLGGSTIDEQSTSACAGRCPAGGLCLQPATVEPTPCDAGHYCPAGTLVAVRILIIVFARCCP